MLDFLEQCIRSFRSLFNRERSFMWFTLLIISFILRDDQLGVTSAIRALMLNGRKYDALLHNFRSDGYDNDAVRKHWYSLVREKAPMLRVNGRVILAGDDVKESKEGFRMPGVKKLHQESENSSKGEYIFGHMFGAVGIIVGNTSQSFCLPLKMRIHDGLQAAVHWPGSDISGENSIVQMIDDGFEAASHIGKAVLVLDRYFLSVSALKRLNCLNRSVNTDQVVIVSKAKKNAVAYEKPVPIAKKRGRPRKKGEPVHLSTLFDKGDFTETTAMMYGKQSKVKYLVRDLLWGTGLYQELRFVLVEYEGIPSILVSTDLTMDAVSIIELYARRYRIECSFRSFKQDIGGFGYHFWTKSLSRLDHFKKQDEPDNLSMATEESDREKILSTIKATERFVMIGCIAMGLLQMIILRETNPESIRSFRYTRTFTKGRVSEATLIYYMQRTLLLSLAAKPHSFINRYIQQARVDANDNMASA